MPKAGDCAIPANRQLMPKNGQSLEDGLLVGLILSWWKQLIWHDEVHSPALCRKINIHIPANYSTTTAKKLEWVNFILSVSSAGGVFKAKIVTGNSQIECDLSCENRQHQTPIHSNNSQFPMLQLIIWPAAGRRGFSLSKPFKMFWFGMRKSILTLVWFFCKLFTQNVTIQKSSSQKQYKSNYPKII